MMAYTVRVQVHEAERGLWCPSCLLPSVVRWAILNVDTLRVLTRFERCEDCGREVRLR